MLWEMSTTGLGLEHDDGEELGDDDASDDPIALIS